VTQPRIRRSPRALTLLAVSAALALAVCAQALADSTPIGALPPGTVTTVSTERGSLVAVAVPKQKTSTGLVWRVARSVNGDVVRQVSEADVGSSVVLVFRAVGAGNASIVLALTRGESSGKAVRAVTYRVRVHA
jgi:hypothetical protein